MGLFLGSVATVSSSDWMPAACEPGPAYCEPGICACANMTRDPTWRTRGFSFSVVLSVCISISGWIRLASGIEVALENDDGPGNWARLNGRETIAKPTRAIGVH